MASPLSGTRSWFLRHWFGAVFLLIGTLWIITAVAYLAGAQGMSFRNRYTGQRAAIDFDRTHDRTVLALADDVGLSLDAGGPTPSGTVVSLQPGLPLVFCWVCGDRLSGGGIARVGHREGEWFFRPPADRSDNSEAVHGRPESRAFILTLAYNRVTRQRIQHEATATVEAQAALLAAHGLAATPDNQLKPAALLDLGEVSMQREGCVVFNAAFVAVCLLWLVLGGAALAIARVVRRLRRAP